MTLDVERRKVLEMIASGKLSANEGSKLLGVLIDTGEEDEANAGEPLQGAMSSDMPAPTVPVPSFNKFWL